METPSESRILVANLLNQSLLHYFDKATGRKSRKPPQFAKKGQKIVALLEAAQLVSVEKFSEYPQLGRFTLRDEGAPHFLTVSQPVFMQCFVGRTIAIGKVSL